MSLKLPVDLAPVSYLHLMNSGSLNGDMNYRERGVNEVMRMYGPWETVYLIYLSSCKIKLIPEKLLGIPEQ